MFKKGDYVSTEILTAEQYDEVVRAFQDAGAGNDYSRPVRIAKGCFLIWDDENDIDAGPSLHLASGQQRSLKEILGE